MTSPLDNTNFPNYLVRIDQIVSLYWLWIVMPTMIEYLLIVEQTKLLFTPKMLARLYVLLFPLIVHCQGLHLDLQWLNRSILDLLENKTYCQVSIDLPDLDYASLPIEGDQFMSFNQADCSAALIIKDLQSLKFEECNQRNHFVKNPQKTFFFINSKPYEDLNMLFQSCLMKAQPYFFILTKIETQFVIEEVQVYAHKIVKVAEFNLIRDYWNINESSIQSLHQRRSNFHGAKVSAQFDNWVPFGYLKNGQFSGYNGELGTIIVNKLNLTLDLKPIQSYGVKLSNGSFTGTLEDLQFNKIDVAMASFIHSPERLEVSEGAFTIMTAETKIVFWKNSGSVFIFGLVFSQELWLSLFGTIITTSLYFFIDLKLTSDSSGNEAGILSLVLIAILTNVKALFAAGHEIPRKVLSIRFYLFSYGLCAAILFWCYTGLLVSYFTAETVEQPISTFSDLKDKPNLRLVLLEGTSDAQFYLRAIQKNPKLEMDIEKNIVWKQPDYDEIINDLFYGPSKQNLILLVDSMTFYYPLFNNGWDQSDQFCQIRDGQLDSAKGKLGNGWLFPKNSILKKPMDDLLLQVTQSGLQEKLMDKYWSFEQKINCDFEYTPLEMNIVWILFKALAIGSGLAFGTLFTELLFKCF